MAEPSVAAGVVRGLIALAVTQGAAHTALMAVTGLDATALADQETRLPMSRYQALVHAAQTLTANPAFALDYGASVDLSEVSVVGLLSLASETMAEALIQLNRYGRLVVDVDTGGVDRFAHVRDGEALWLVDHRRDANAFPELTEITFARMATGPRRFSETLRIHAVEVTHAAPAHAEAYARILGAPVTFGAARNAIRIDESWARHRVAQQPRYVFGILSAHADARMAELRATTTTSGRVEALLMPILHTGDTKATRIACDLGMSRETLYRRLKAEDTSFVAVLDRLRQSLARDYLGTRKVSVHETAYLLGFSDPAAFSRAFRRWTGTSPGQFRADRLINPAEPVASE